VWRGKEGRRLLKMGWKAEDGFDWQARGDWQQSRGSFILVETTKRRPLPALTSCCPSGVVVIEEVVTLQAEA
jgi:hypothetical protein